MTRRPRIDVDALREQLAAMWDTAADSDRTWTPLDAAAAEIDADPEPSHPRFDDPDHAAMYAYRNEVSSA